LFLEGVRHGGPQPHLSHRLADHVLVAARVAEVVEHRELFALVGGEPRERVAAAARRHGVGDLDDLVAEDALAVEHRRERHRLRALDLLSAAVLDDRPAAHEGEGAVPGVRGVLQTQRGTPATTTATPHVGVMWRLPVNLRSDVLGEPCDLGTGAVPVEGRVVTALRIDVVADVALIRLHHVGAEPGAHRGASDHAAHHLAAERLLVAPVGTLEGLEHAALVGAVGREVEAEAGVGSFESPVDVAQRQWSVPLLVLVDVGGPEEGVSDDVGLSIEHCLPHPLPGRCCSPQPGRG
jgi:hypothetical protein